MKLAMRLHLVVLMVSSIVMSPIAFATNGYFLIGYGAKSRAMGGASVAFPTDAMASASNPAGITEVGSSAVVGAEIFYPPRHAGTPDDGGGLFGLGKGTTKSGSNVFLIPSMGFTYKFNRRISIGFSAIGNGANTRYNEEDNFFDLLADDRWTLGVQLLQMQMLPTLAYRVNKQNSIGASLALGVQQFRAYGIGDFGIPEFQFSSDNDNLSNRGNDYGYGAGIRLGWLGKYFDDRLSFGVNYASKVYMTKFDKYKGLFAEKGSFDIPENYAFGFALKVIPKLTIAGDVMKILYSDVKSVGNRHATTSILDPCTRPLGLDPSQCAPGRTSAPEPVSAALGNKDGWGFGWRDSTAYKLGLAYAANDQWTLRAGVNYGKSVVRDEQLLFNTLATAVVEWHATVGFTYAPNAHQEWNFNATHAFENSQTCDAPSCQTMFTQGEGQYVGAKMKIYTAGVSWGYKF